MVTPLVIPQVEVSEGMLGVAENLEQIARDIREGKVRAVAVSWVESGPEMNVGSNWCTMSGKATLTGGLYRLLNAVSST
jgi:hypothetical protein